MSGTAPRETPHVGIFWLVQTPNGEMTLLAAGCPLEQAEPYGDCLTYGHDIADNVITPKMRDQFQSEIVRLAAEKVRVEVVRSGGQFGSPQYQVRLFANPKAKVHIVLSEGEQTCVALAAFLTELTTASHKSALVFDDPVTSLDHRWRRPIGRSLSSPMTLSL